MIEIKQAVNAAKDHLIQLYGKLPSVQLEEVFRSDDDRSWLVTLSFLTEVDPEETPSIYGMLAKVHPDLAGGARLVRKFKTFEVESETGTVRSMKIRPVPSV